MFIFTNDYICLVTIFLLKIKCFNKIVIYMLLRNISPLSRPKHINYRTFWLLHQLKISWKSYKSKTNLNRPQEQLGPYHLITVLKLGALCCYTFSSPPGYLSHCLQCFLEATFTCLFPIQNATAVLDFF